VLGLLLAVICLSGSLAVLRFDIDQMVHGRGAQDGGEPASWDRVIATAQAGDCPLADDELDWIAAPRATGGAIELWYRPDGGDYQRRFLCPVRGTVLGDTRGHWRSASMAWIAELHRTLLLGAVGGWLLGIGAFALLGFVATGLYLWWPSLRRGWAAVGRIRWGTGSFLRHYDTHQVVAIWCVPVFLLAALYEDRRTKPLTIAGPDGTEARVRNLASAVGYDLEARDWSFPIRFRELAAGQEEEVGPVRARTFETRHQPDVHPHGISISAGPRRVVYSGDTGWFDALPSHVAGADLFVCECTYFGFDFEYHLNHRLLSARKSEFDCGRMVLTHLGSEMADRRGRCDFDTADDGLKLEL